MPLSKPDFLVDRLAQPVAVFGGAVSAGGAIALLGRLGAAAETYDLSTAGFTSESAARHRLVVFSPGFSLHHPWLELARKSGCICMAEIDFASLFWNGHILAITGTNGKTTLTEFLVHALEIAGGRAVATGNIGVPFSRVVAELEGGEPGTIAVCEVSSFQAEQLGHFYSDGLIWTNFAEDHLERHTGMETYFAAKWELVTRSPARRFFCGTSVQRYASHFGRALAPASCIATERQPADPALEGTVFATYPQRENFILAAAWWSSEGMYPEVLYRAARTFRLGRHRLAKVGSVDGVTFWNDSKATNFHAVEAALDSFSTPVVLIAGGRAKGGDIAGFARRISGKVAHAFLIGETAPALAAAFGAARVPATLCGGLEEAVRLALAAAGSGRDVLLSPGFSSFDMFRNYEERGDRFEKAVADMNALSLK